MFNGAINAGGEYSMSSPFPGMDPYLEDRHIWPGFHHSLAEEIKTQLNQQIGPKYYADVEVRTVMHEVGIASQRVIYRDTAVFEQQSKPPAQPVEMSGTATATPIAPAPVQRPATLPSQTRLRAVRIYVTETAELVTTIEILSPFNKQPGDGLEEYRRKRRAILQSPVHLVELDLLRAGQRPGAEVAYPPLDAEYILLVNRATVDETRLSDIWPVTLDQPLPVLPIPLLRPDPDVPLDLNGIIAIVYAKSGYSWRIDYTQPVPPPELRPETAEWLAQINS
jgi:hypothetical protein